MRALRVSLGLVLGLGLTACESLKSGEGDAGPGPDAGPLHIERTPRVGDSLAGGEVTAVTGLGLDGCTRVVVEDPPEWECSAELTRTAREGSVDRGDYDEEPPVADPIEPPSAQQKASLAEATCASLADLRREPLKEQMRARVEGERRQQLRKCLPVSRALYFDRKGNESEECADFGAPEEDAAAEVADAASGGDWPARAGGASEYSTTNTQVIDVDEADFVKNDNQYVYVLSQAGLHVIDAWPAEDTHEIGYLAQPGQPTRLFLAGDKLVVYVRISTNVNPDASARRPSAAQTCTYGYDCRFGAEPGQTLVRVYDVKNPAAPKQLVEYELSGGYLASRRVGNVVYTVVFDRPLAAAPSADTRLQTDSPEQLEESYAAALGHIDETVDALEDSYFLPWVEQRGADGKLLAKLTSCDEALVADSASGRSLTSLVSFDLSQLGAPQRTLVASGAGFIYASTSALYVASDGVGGADVGARYYGASANERSTIHKFALEGVSTRYVGSASIRGHVLNQFSMDERANVLRVATSSGWVPSPDVSSNITQLAESNGELKVVGELTGLAPQEDIRSVRFDGERGFMVTFKKTDPLFVIDLSEVGKPRVLGELKIPGYSTYMHPLDADHLLAIGLDADDRGSFAFFNGIQLQIFDVSQLSAPKLLHKTAIGTRGSTSDALTNHLAFNYFAPKGLLALPMTVCEGGGNGQFGDKLTFSGLMVFDVSLQSGVVERGRMPFVSSQESANITDCNGWWTQGRSAVKRSIFMDDYAIGISDTLYTVAKLSKLDSALVNVSLLP